MRNQLVKCMVGPGPCYVFDRSLLPSSLRGGGGHSGLSGLLVLGEPWERASKHFCLHTAALVARTGFGIEQHLLIVG